MTTQTSEQTLFSLKGFEITEHPRGKAWKITCEKCGGKWQLKKGGEKHPENMLALLDHRVSHER